MGEESEVAATLDLHELDFRHARLVSVESDSPEQRLVLGFHAVHSRKGRFDWLDVRLRLKEVARLSVDTEGFSGDGPVGRLDLSPPWPDTDQEMLTLEAR